MSVDFPRSSHLKLNIAVKPVQWNKVMHFPSYTYHQNLHPYFILWQNPFSIAGCVTNRDAKSDMLQIYY